jgi:DNA-binding GntR family transcriptional regulator
MLEPTALQQAAPSLPPALLERALATVTEALDGFPREGFDTDVVENDLHVSVLSYCPNDEILQSLARTRVLFVPTRYLYDPVLQIPLSLIEDALKEHQQIYCLLLDQRANDAAMALQRHLKNADERWFKRFEGSAGHKQEALPSYLAPP